VSAGAGVAVATAVALSADDVTRPPLAQAAGQTTAKASAARAALKLIWGPNDLPDGTSAFPTYQRLGVDVLERQLSWRATATRRPASPRDPADPAYQWPASLDEAVARAAAAHIQLAIMVRQTPDWANGDRGDARAPNKDADYADFLRAASRHYAKVRYWMIWGEPSRAGVFTPMPAHSPVGPRRYATLLDASYAALKAERSSNVVIGGMTWTLGEVYPAEFVKWMKLPNGRPPRLDYFGHNPFATRFPDIRKGTYYPGLRDISDTDTLHAELTTAYRSRGRTPPLWLSEYTVGSDRANRAFTFYVSRKEQARWITAAFKLADEASYVKGLGWYELLDESPKDIDRPLTSGLLDYRGRPKPAFDAYRKAR